MDIKARKAVFEYAKRHLDPTDGLNLTFESVYIVWQCCILGNFKFLISTTLPDGMYYEVTFNKAQSVMYLDAYKRFDQEVHAV